MKKRSFPTKLADHISPVSYRAKTPARQTVAKEFYADGDAAKPRLHVNYVSKTHIPEKPPESTSLFIRGLVGGSMKIDLRGLGVGFSDASFGQWVADESLKQLHIHRGDIAIIDPARPALKDCNVVLTIVDGREVFRWLKKCANVWRLETADGVKSDFIPLIDQPILGIVMGTLRLFTHVKATRHSGLRFELEPSHERSRSSIQGKRHPARSSAKQNSVSKTYRQPRRAKVVLASEDKIPYCGNTSKRKTS